MRCKLFVVTGILVFAAGLFFNVGTAAAEEVIYTGGRTGTYHTIFGKKLEEILTEEGWSHERVRSGGSVDNILKVSESPNSIGFTQFDAYALATSENPELKEKVKVVKTGITDECLCAIARTGEFENWGLVRRKARKGNLKIVIGPENSGTEATVKFLASLDRELQKSMMINAKFEASLRDLKSGKADVIMYVTYPTPNSKRFETINADDDIEFVPVVSRKITNAKLDGKNLYEIKEMVVEASYGGFKAKKVPTACTTLAVIANAESEKELIYYLENDLEKEELEPSKSISERIARLTALSVDKVKELVDKVEEMAGGE